MTELQKQQCKMEAAMREYLKHTGWIQSAFGYWLKETMDQCGHPVAIMKPPLLAFHYEIEGCHSWISDHIYQQYLSDVAAVEPPTSSADQADRDYDKFADAFIKSCSPPTSSTTPTEASAITPQEKPATGDSQATTAMGWRPIELAPKDGTKFLGVKADTQYPVYSVFHFSNDRDGWTSLRGCQDMCEPTHFMPLPKAPTV